MTKPATHSTVRQKGPIGFRTVGKEGPVASRLTRAATDWAWGIGIGLLAVTTGVLALLDADGTLSTLTVLIGASQAFQGILSILAGWRTATDRTSRRRQLFFGILLVGAGGASLVATGPDGLVIASSVWFAILAVQDFLDAAKTDSARTGRTALGVVSLLAAALVLTHPDITLTGIARYIGISLICRGVLQIGRSWTQHIHEKRPMS